MGDNDRSSLTGRALRVAFRPLVRCELECALEVVLIDVRFGSLADILHCNRYVRFASDFDRKSRHRLAWRMVLWLATQEFDNAKTSDPDAIHTHRCPLEQGQANWS